MIAPRVQKYLEELCVKYDVIAHPYAQTGREAADLAHIPADHLAKGIVLANGHDGLLVVVPADRHIRLHTLQRELGRPLRLAQEREFQHVFDDCVPGALPPFGFLYGMETLIDNELCELGNNYFAAGDHEHLVHVSGDAFRQLVQGTRHGYFSHAD